jgi:hypothetical protein
MIDYHDRASRLRRNGSFMRYTRLVHAGREKSGLWVYLPPYGDYIAKVADMVISKINLLDLDKCILILYTL